LPFSLRHRVSGLRAGVFAKSASMPIYLFEAAMSRLKQAVKTLQIPLKPLIIIFFICDIIPGFFLTLSEREGFGVPVVDILSTPSTRSKRATRQGLFLQKFNVNRRRMNYHCSQNVGNL
jgi:hypothetical protein